MAIRYRSYIKEAERFYIEIELRKGTSVPAIARALNRDKSTIYAEIRRGSCKQIKSTPCGYEEVNVYFADHAERLSRQRQARKGTSLKIGNDIELAQLIEKLINEKHWSPRSVVGYLEVEGKLTTPLSYRTVYNYIHWCVLEVDEKNLPWHGIKRRAAAKRYKKAKGACRGKSIELRPDSIASRLEFGHWEGDLVVGKQGTKTVVLTLLERKTRFCIAVKLPDRKAKTIAGALDKLERKCGRLWRLIFKTITFDNGSEFADPDALERSCYKKYRDKDGNGGRCAVYYAHPYSSCERGSNENCNGLLRRGGIIKGSNIGTLPKGTVEAAMEWVNSLPRGILNYRTAKKAFEREVSLLAAS